MNIETIEIKTLDLDPANVRRHSEKNLGAIRSSLKRFGQQKPIVVNEDGVVIAGNGTLTAARDLGWQSIQVVRTNLLGAEATAFAIADNRTAELAEWDSDALTQQLSALDLEDSALVEAAGFEPGELEAMVTGILGEEPKPGNTDPDDTPEVTGEPMTQRGDVWTLGSHRLVCGDSTNEADVAKLLDGRKADLIFTDPPYDLGGKAKQVAKRELRGKSYGKLYDSDWDKGFKIEDIGPSIADAMADDCSVYVCTSHFYLGSLIEMFDDLMSYHNVCIWSKSNPMPSLTKRHWTWAHEFIVYGTRGRHTFNFPATGNLPSVWEIAKSPKNDLHPTQKPVGIPSHAIEASSKPGDLVVDLFGGSGSTLIAAEQLGRTAYLMELDPKYCDTIVKRFEEFTGLKGVRNGNAEETGGEAGT